MALYAFLTAMALVWLFPLVWGIYTALRPFSRHAGQRGYISIARDAQLRQLRQRLEPAASSRSHFLSTLIVTIPAVIVTLILASMVAFAVSRFSWRFNLLFLLIFTAGNLLPPQVIIVPLYKLYTALHGIPPPLSDNGPARTTSTSA